MRLDDGLTPASLEVAAQTFSLGLAELERNGGKPTSPVAVELEMKRKDGSTVWIEVQMSFMQDAQGKVVGIMGVARDIDERRRARKSLEESEERYRFLAENASDIIWVIASDLKFTYISPSVTRLLGYGTNEIIGRAFDQLLTPDSLALMAQAYLGDMVGEERRPGSLIRRTVEIEAVCKDGSTAWLEAAINAVRDKEGRIVGFRERVATSTSATEGQQALKESEERFRALIEGARDAIAVVDLRGKVTIPQPIRRAHNGWRAGRTC